MKHKCKDTIPGFTVPTFNYIYGACKCVKCMNLAHATTNMLIYGGLQNAKRDANVASEEMQLTREVPKHRSEYARPFLQLFINI